MENMYDLNSASEERKGHIGRICAQKNISVREMPELERPREKLSRYGVAALSNAELVALLLGSGTGNVSALALAGQLISRDPSGILFLVDCTLEELCSVKGIGPAKASVIMAAVEIGRRIMTAPRRKKIKTSSPEQIAALFMEKMRYLKKEVFKVLLLNVKNEIISIEDVSMGSISNSEAHPREVFSAPVRRGAASVVLVHNHPSGNPEPSESDLLVTQRMALAGDILGIKVLDHVIIGDGSYVSLKSEGAF